MKTCIISCAESKFVEREDEYSLDELVYSTTKSVLSNAGMGHEQIDCVIHAGDDVLDGININHVYQVEAAGSLLKEESKIEADGAYALFYAIARLLSGGFSTALVIGYSKASESSLSFVDGYKPYSSPEVSGSWYYHTQLEPFYLRPLKYDVVSYHALQYSSFLHKSKLTEEDVAICTQKNKMNGLKNTNAPFASDMSVNDILSSDYVSSPIRINELPPQTDGVTALIVSTEQWMKENKKEGVYITGFGMSADSYYPGYRDLSECQSANIAMAKAKKMSNVDNVESAELYSLFSYQELMLYKELFGWGYEEIKEKVKGNYTGYNSSLPVNRSGGVICAHPILASGLSRIMHSVNQIKTGKCQNSLSHSQSGLGMQNNIVYILEA